MLKTAAAIFFAAGAAWIGQICLDVFDTGLTPRTPLDAATAASLICVGHALFRGKPYARLFAALFALIIAMACVVLTFLLFDVHVGHGPWLRIPDVMLPAFEYIAGVFALFSLAALLVIFGGRRAP